MLPVQNPHNAIFKYLYNFQNLRLSDRRYSEPRWAIEFLNRVKKNIHICNGKKVWHIGERTENCYTHGDKWEPINTLRLENLVFRHPAKTIGGLNTGVRRRHNIIAYDYQLFLLFTACSTLRRCFRNIFRYCSLQGCTIKLFSSYVARGAIVRCSNQVKKKAIYISVLHFRAVARKARYSPMRWLIYARYMIFEHRYDGNWSGYVIIE